MNKHLENPDVETLLNAFASLKSKADIAAFLEDIATIQEIKDFAMRLQVAKRLKLKQTYTEIEEATGASATTIARVNKSLIYGAGGYDLVLKNK